MNSVLPPLIINSDQRCIVGTANGLVSFFPRQLQDSIYPTGAQLTGIYINDVLYAATPNSNEIKKIGLSHRENTFSFDFSPIAFQHSADCVFEYKLEGYDEDWIKSSTAHYTRYSKIPPGNYFFNLRIINARGRVSPFTKTLEIKISRAYWQTTLFKIISLAFLLSIGGLFFQNGISVLRSKNKKGNSRNNRPSKKKEQELLLICMMIFGSGLSRIKFLSQSILNKNIGDKVIKTELEKITSFSDEMSEKWEKLYGR